MDVQIEIRAIRIYFILPNGQIHVYVVDYRQYDYDCPSSYFKN